MKKLAQYRYDWNTILGSDKYRYGDLYGFSYIGDYKFEVKRSPLPVSNCNRPGFINLYMICDSYLWSFVKSDSIFCNVNKLEYTRWKYGEYIEEKFDSTKNNILIIELSERFVRKLLKDSVEMYSYLNIYKDHPDPLRFKIPTPNWKKFQLRLHNETISQNLEFNLFDYIFISPLKQLKADFNYKVFNRTDKDVVVSENKKYLFYRETADSLNKASSFYPLSDNELSDIVECINAEYNHFKSIGFDEVYLSIIPNPVSIVDPGYGNYNKLISRLEGRNDLIIPLIKVFDIFKSWNGELYFRSDTHWNSDGFKIWVEETNKILSKYKRKQNYLY